MLLTDGGAKAQTNTKTAWGVSHFGKRPNYRRIEFLANLDKFNISYLLTTPLEGPRESGRNISRVIKMT
jgi:hypothetical protein